MDRITLNLDRPPCVTFNQDSAGETVQLHRRGEVQRLPRHDQLRLLDIRHDRLRGLEGTPGSPGESQRRSHQAQIVPACSVIMARVTVLSHRVTRKIMRRPIVRQRVSKMFVEAPPELRSLIATVCREWLGGSVSVDRHDDISPFALAVADRTVDQLLDLDVSVTHQLDS